jgi:predicted Zn-dependent protease
LSRELDPLVSRGRLLHQLSHSELEHLDPLIQVRKVDKPLVRMAVLFSLSNVALHEGRLEEAEARAREARELVERFQLHRVPQATLVPIALGRVLAERGELEEAQEELEYAHSSRRRLSPV